MGKETGIKWTDSTFNSWHGCTKVGPACDHCYAEVVDQRGTAKDQPLHWGHGVSRRLISEKARNEPYRWNRNADQFFAEHGRRQRVFTLSMGDLFDNEVPTEWRMDHFRVMAETPRLEWQICTKRVSNIAKMVPENWRAGPIDTSVLPAKSRGFPNYWPDHVGVLITIVTQAEADRDCRRLLNLKRELGIPWVGVSYEPAQEGIYWYPFLGDQAKADFGASLDWIIFGGKSGSQWNDRPFETYWGRTTLEACRKTDTAFFFKQVAAARPTDAMIPADLMIRQWPKGH